MIYGSANQEQANRSINQEFRAAKTTFIIISGFAICYLPYIAGSIFLYRLRYSTSNSKPIFTLTIFWTSTLVFFNSLINPLIYGWRVKEIKNLAKDIFAAKVNSLETENAKRKKRLQRQKREKTRGNNTTFSLSVIRRLERRLSIPTKLTSVANEYVKPNMRRRHTLQAVIFNKHQ